MTDFTLGISPCPNDTFIFYHLLFKSHFKFKTLIRDVEELNRLVLEKRLDISKVSFALAGKTLNNYLILRSGAALGRGCGPLVLSREKMEVRELKGKRIAIPGENTTATLLLRLFLNEKNEFIPMLFSKIPFAIKEGKVDAGCVIHETRFTYKDMGLHLVMDLGKWWEQETRLPIPLGGIVAKRDIPGDFLLELEMAIRKSIEYSEQNFNEVSKFITSHAQEISKEVQKKHIGLYVNEFSKDIGDEGKRAIGELFARAHKKGLMDLDSKFKEKIFLD